MSIDVLSAAPVAIQIHLVFVTISILMGPFALLRGRKDVWHKAFGYLWVAAMFGVVGTSLFISETPMLGPFSPIHILSVITLASLIYALRAALRRDFGAHGRAMRALYAQALIIPGVFTFLPGRRMNGLFGGGQDMAAFWVAAIVGTLVMAGIWFHPALSRAVGLQDGAGRQKSWRRIPLFFAWPKR